MSRLARLLAAATATLLSLAAPVPADAHAAMKQSVPASGAVADPAPSEVRIRFNEPLEAAFCTVQVIGPDGQPLPAAAVRAVDGDPTALVLPLARPAAPGAYRVRWSAMGRDGHRTKGEFGFTVPAR